MEGKGLMVLLTYLYPCQYLAMCNNQQHSNVNVTRMRRDDGSKQPRASEVAAAVEASPMP